MFKSRRRPRSAYTLPAAGSNRPDLQGRRAVPLSVADVRASRVENTEAGLLIQDEGGDPQIVLRVEDEIAGGVFFEVDFVSEKLVRPCIYLDFGQGVTEASRIEADLDLLDRHRFHIPDATGLRQIRYDPSESAGQVMVLHASLFVVEPLDFVLEGVRVEGIDDLDLGTLDGSATFLGHDPKIILRPAASLATADAVRLEFDIRSEAVAGRPKPRLYLGPSEDEALDLSFDGRVFSCYVVDPGAIPRFRLDPADRAGKARIARIAMVALDGERLGLEGGAAATGDPEARRRQAVGESLMMNGARSTAVAAWGGRVESIRNGRVSGTAWTRNRGDEVPFVELWREGRLIGAAEARPIPGIGERERHFGFIAAFPPESAPAGASIAVQLRGGAQLENSPVEVEGKIAGDPPSLIEKRAGEVLRDIYSRLHEEPARSFRDGPLISILTPVYNVPELWLKRMVQSVLRQSYENWELCLVDDGSTDGHLRDVLTGLAENDGRIKIKMRERNGGISAASNDALALATGDYVALLDNDDMLTADALAEMAAAIAENHGPDWLYSDEFKIDRFDAPSQLFAKPDWSPFYMLNYMYTGHFTLYRTELVRRLGGFRSEYDFSQDYDLALRMSEATTRVVHVAKYLYGWRMIEGSAAQGGKPKARISNIAALQDAVRRRGWNGEAVPLPTANRVVMSLPVPPPSMSIVIPSDSVANISASITSIVEDSSYETYEIIVVTRTKTIEELGSRFPDVRWAAFDEPFNFSAKCNVGAKVARGDYVVFYNDDVRVVTAGWMEALLEYLILPGVGVVGPKLVYENGLIQHGGMVTGVRRLVGTAFHAYPARTSTHFNMAQCVRDVSLICGALLAMPLKLFREVGGFDAENVPIMHSDVDLCFRVRELGHACVYTPYAELQHIGHVSIGETEAAEGPKLEKSDPAAGFILRRFTEFLARDPYFPPPLRDLVYLDSQENFTAYPGAPEAARSGEGGASTLIVSHDLSASGAPKVVYDLALALRDSGGYVAVVSPVDGPYREKLVANGVTVVVDPIFLDAPPDALALALGFERVIGNTILTWRVLGALSGRAQTIMYAHETSLSGVFAERYPDFVDLLDRVSQLWAGSERAAQAMRALGGRPIVVEYGVDEPPPVSRRPLVRVAMFGSFEPRKGQDLAVLAWKTLPADVRTGARLSIYGRTLDPTFRTLVEHLSAEVDSVELVSELTYDRYLETLEDTDVVLVASRDDTLPLVSLDALSRGKVLICTCATGTSAYLETGVSALLAENPSPEDIAAELNRALTDRELRIRIGRGGREVYEREFTLAAFESRLAARLGPTNRRAM